MSADQPSGFQKPFSFRQSPSGGDAHLYALAWEMRTEVRRTALNSLIVEGEMFAAHMNSLGSSAINLEGRI